MIKQSLENKLKNLRDFIIRCCIWNWLQPKVCFGVIKHLLNWTSSNIRIVLLGSSDVRLTFTLHIKSLASAKQV